MRKISKDDFIKKCNLNHNNKYIYDFSDFNGLECEFTFKCPKHGDLKMIAKKHYRNGCRYCIREKRFIENSSKIHNRKYNYSKVDYTNNKTKVSIICPKHGIFKQTPEAHLYGQGCPNCKVLDKDQLLNKINIKHGNKYGGLDKIIYKNASTKFKLLCPKHGEFDVCPKNLNGCKKCANEKLSLDTESFIEKSSIIHNNKYDYSLVDYINNKTPVKIICKKHGTFEQKPNDHLSGHGCRYCKISSGEELISNILNGLNISFIREYKFHNCKNNRSLPFDFYLPDINSCIEYNGKQHYEPIDYFGGSVTYNKTILRDKIKIDFCKENNINLLIISYLDKDIYSIIYNFIDKLQ